MTAEWNSKDIRITISDDGRGFAHQVMDQIGDPYVTTRPSDQHGKTTSDEHVGMGLGFFIAKTFLERSGGTLSMRNKEYPETGAVVQISWPRKLVDTTNEISPAD